MSDAARTMLRFAGKKGQVFLYEAGYRLVGNTSISFPVEVDLSKVRGAFSAAAPLGEGARVALETMLSRAA